MIKPKRIDAIAGLSPKTGFSSDNDGNVIEWDISSTKSGLSQPTEEAIQTKLASMISDWEAQEYARNRATEYPAIADQLDEIYHNGIDSWKAVIKVTKDKYPKG